MSPEVLERFFASPRPTSLPYTEWLMGERLLLVQGEDFSDSPRKVVANILGFARRRDWAVVAVLARRPTDPARGPATCIQVWGDPNRSYAEGPPDEIRRELERRLRRKQ